MNRVCAGRENFMKQESWATKKNDLEGCRGI